MTLEEVVRSITPADQNAAAQAMKNTHKKRKLA